MKGLIPLLLMCGLREMREVASFVPAARKPTCYWCNTLPPWMHYWKMDTGLKDGTCAFDLIVFVSLVLFCTQVRVQKGMDQPPVSICLQRKQQVSAHLWKAVVFTQVTLNRCCRESVIYDVSLFTCNNFVLWNVAIKSCSFLIIF